MRKLLLFAPVLIGAQALALSVDHTGLQTSFHGLEVNDNTVRVELHNWNEMRVISTGEKRSNQGELNHMALRLDGLMEFDSTRWEMPFDIYNLTKEINGGRGYIDIDVNDRLELYDGNRTDADGVRPQKTVPWINARRGSRISITLSARELDCSGQNVCGRGDTGTVVYEMTIPPIPSNLPTTCGAQNSFRGVIVGGEFQFFGTLDSTRAATGKPTIEPSEFESDSFLCFLPVREE